MRTPQKFNKSKEWLIENYLNTDKSFSDIAKIISCSPSIVRKWVLKYGIKPKPKYRAALNNLILYQNGNKPWNKGLGMEDERIKKAVEKSVITRKLRGTHLGAKHGNWKGDKVTYKPLHKWVNYHKGKAKLCLDCGSTKNVDWANISGQYKRDLNDFKSLCRSCHMKFDNARRGGEL